MNRRRTVGRLLAAVSVAIVSGVVATPGVAHADTFRTATATSWGGTPAIGAANAEGEARRNLAIQAITANEACTNVTSSSTPGYRAPDGSAYYFSAVASGTCALIPPYSILRVGNAVGAGPSFAIASDNSVAAAQALVLAGGVNCTNWVLSGRNLYTAPDRSWYTMEATARALCTN
jgi:hypothetical protein